MKKLVSQFLFGFSAPFVGALLIARQRALFRLSILPFVFTVLIFIVGLSFGLPLITRWVTPFTQSILSLFGLRTSTGIGETLALIFPFLIWPALALALIFMLLNITRLAASPFYSLLAEKVLRNGGALPNEAQPLFGRVTTQLRQARSSFVKTAVFIVMGLVLGFVSFIPGVGLVTGFFILILLSYDVVDYSLEALEWPLRRRVAFFREHFAVFVGLGLSLGVVFLVPGLNFCTSRGCLRGGGSCAEDDS